MQGNTSFVVAVDNEVAVENLKRLAESQNYQASVETKDGNFHVTFVGDGAAAPVCEESNKPKNWALFVGKDFIGDGSEELGNSLMTMFFYTLAESNDAPRYILFMNSGVKLPGRKRSGCRTPENSSGKRQRNSGLRNLSEIL